MVRHGAAGFLNCRGSSGQVRIKGVVVEDLGEEVVLAFDPSLASQVTNSLVHSCEGGESVAFLKVKLNAVSLVTPEGWASRAGGRPPAPDFAQKAWSKAAKDLVSSEAEQFGPKGQARAQATSRTDPAADDLSKQLKRLQATFQGRGEESSGGSESSESEEDDELIPPTPSKSKSKMLPPGAPSSRKEKKVEKDKREPDMNMLLQQAMFQQLTGPSSSSGAANLTPMLLMMLTQQRQQLQQSFRKAKSANRRKSEPWNPLVRPPPDPQATSSTRTRE